MTELRKVEKEFITWLDNVNYSGYTKDAQAVYYRLIEGKKNGVFHRVSFIVDIKNPKPRISSRAIYPRAEQNYTIESFYQWMKEEGQRKRLIFQAP